MTTNPDTAALRARLETSRAALLDAIARLTEQDFASDLGDGASVVETLADLAAGERATAAEVGGEAAVLPGRESTASLAPQAVHDLAGARFETLRVLDAIEGSAQRDDAALAAIAATAGREEAAAGRIRKRFATD
ncbi:MAG: hypothetical protein OXH97_01370 [Chloroflexota bacterium]|nr:hypothetical protein [Chloroflexota bacterium]